MQGLMRMQMTKRVGGVLVLGLLSSSVLSCAGAQPATVTIPSSRLEGCLGDSPPPGVVLWSERMTRPEPALGPALALTKEAAEYGSDGTVRVRCIVTTDGMAKGCVLLESAPYMGEAALEALGKQRFVPAKEDGVPVAVEYDFIWKIQAPGTEGEAKLPSRALEGKSTEFAPPRQTADPQARRTSLVSCNHVEGIMVIRCAVDEEGKVTGCRVRKTLPYLERAVVESLEASRYPPIIIDGRPQRVNYTFTVKLMPTP